MAATCWNEKDKELVHKGYEDTGRTRTETQKGRTVTWRVVQCQCGATTMDVR